MKYADEAWTEPEPAGFEQDELVADPRLLDKAYGAPPAGGWLTVGGTPNDLALNDGRLPPGHSPSVPTPAAPEITIPGGAVDEEAVVTLAGDYLAGTTIDMTREASADPDSPVGAPYPIDYNNRSGASVAAGWAAYLSVGIGYTVKAEGNVMTFTPDPGESITLSAIGLSGPSDLVVEVTTAAGDDTVPAVTTVTSGSSAPGDTVEVTVTTDVETYTRTWVASSIMSVTTVARALRDLLNGIPGVSADNWNRETRLLATGTNTTVNIDSVVVTVANPGGGGQVDTIGASVPQPAGSAQEPAMINIDGVASVDGQIVVEYDTDGTNPNSVGVGFMGGATADEIGQALCNQMETAGLQCSYLDGVLYVQPVPPAEAVAITGVVIS